MVKNIMIVIPGMYYGGMERVAFIMREMLIKNGYEVVFVTLFNNDADYQPNFEYLSLECDIRPSKIGKILNTFKRIYRMRMLKRKINPSLTISFGQSCNLVNVLTKKKDKTLVGIRSYDWLYNYLFHYQIDKFVYKHADNVVSVSKLIKRDAEKIFKFEEKNSYSLYNPYDLQWIDSKCQEEITEIQIPSEKRIIVTAGRLEDQKGLYHLIKAISLMKNKENIVVYILGNGSRRQLLEKLIDDLQLNEIVYLIGGQPNPYKFMARADLYVMTSITEGFPNALVEAMATGTAVLSSDCKSGPREILSDLTLDKTCKDIEYTDAGILVCPMIDSKNYTPKHENCDRTLSEAIEQLLENNRLLEKYAKAARKRAKLYSYESFEKNLLNIISYNNI